MTAPLLTTKLFIPPLRPELVSRPRLIEQLNAGLHRKLTLLSAPAGFGKTTLLSEWVGQTDTPVAWLSLDEGDNDPARFLAYVIAALQAIPGFSEAELGRGALASAESLQPQAIESVLTAIINELTEMSQSDSSRRLALVLDDYHVIEAQAIDRTLAFLLDRLPPHPKGMHLIIAGRADPSLSLSRLRAAGQMTEMGVNDLRFTFDEATTFLNQVMGLNLIREHIAALETRTEGWIAGLQLAALSMQGEHPNHIQRFIETFTGSHRYVVDYLIDEVLKRRPPGTRSFLLQTSILDRLSGSLCDAVCGVSRGGAEQNSESTIREHIEFVDAGQATLERLEEANLFLVPLDNERRWYRYHHLFAELLRNLLATSQPDLVPTLHRRASKWYAQNDLMSEAIAHSLAAGDFDQAAQLTEQTCFDRMSRGEDFATMLARLEALPEEIIRARPRLGVMYAWMLSITFQLDVVEPRLREIERMAGDQLPADLRLQIAHIRAELTRYRGDYARAIELSLQILEILPEKPSATDVQTRTGTVFNLAWAYLWAGDVTKAQRWFSEALTVSCAAGSLQLTLLALRGLSHVHELQGQLRQAADTCRQGLQIAREAAQQSRQPVTGAAYFHLGMGDLYREWNELDEAERHLVQGMEIGRKWQIGGDTLRDGYLLQARLKQAQGDMAGALDMIRHAQRLAQVYQSVPGFDLPIAACRARLMLSQAVSSADDLDARHLEAIEQWGEERVLRVDDPVHSLHDEFERLVWARLLIVRNEPILALQFLAQLLQAAEGGGRMARIIEIWILQALAHQALGVTDRALLALRQALTLSEPGGYIRLFVDEGRPMEELLRLAASLGIAPDHVRKLLAAFGTKAEDDVAATEPSPASVVPRRLSSLVEPLSKRELEVLQRIATGLTNREIAGQLSIAVSTVKTHVKNIHAKLGVRNRTQAVARARELNLLR